MIYNNIRIKIIIVILFLFIFLLNAEANPVSEEKQITVVFRFDDYSSRSRTSIEVKLIDAFQKHNVSCTFGVIPYVCVGNWHDAHPQDVVPLTQAKADILKNAIKAGVLEVALHGYSHQTIREGTDGGDTEFSGVDYNGQVKKITKGKNYLEEILNTQITTFIPPWHSYDLNTTRALEKLGIECISAGTDGIAEESSSLKFLPAICGLIQLRDAVESARRIPDNQPIIIVLFHQYDFREVDRKRGSLGYQDFVELLAWIVSQKDIHVRSIEQTAKVIGDLSVHRFINYKLYLKVYSLTPPFLYFGTPKVYFSSNTVYNLKINCRTAIAVFYPALLVIFIIIGFFGGLFVFSETRLMPSIYKYSGPAVLVLILIYLIYALCNLELGYEGVMFIVALLGVCIGAWGALLKSKKQSRLR